VRHILEQNSVKELQSEGKVFVACKNGAGGHPAPSLNEHRKIDEVLLSINVNPWHTHIVGVAITEIKLGC